MSDDFKSPDDFGLTIPWIDIKIGESNGENRNIAYKKTFPFAPLRELAHDLLVRVEDGDKRKGFDEYSDLVAVIILLVASIEAFVNDMLIYMARRDYGKKYKQISEGLLGGSLRSRLLRIIPIASKGRKRLNTEHNIVGVIFNLVKTRNKLVHSTEYYVENISWEEAYDVPLGKALTLEQCSNYAGAVDAYFGAVLSGLFVIKGKTPWDNELVLDAEPEKAG